MKGLWRIDEETAEGKYPIVLRRDGTVLEGPYFVIVSRDPCAAAAFNAYADAAEAIGLNSVFVHDIRVMAEEAESIAAQSEKSDPDAPPHRTDDPAILAWSHSVHGKKGQGH